MTFRDYLITFSHDTNTSLGRMVSTKLVRRTSQKEALASFKEMYKADIEAEIGSPIKVLGARRA